MNHWFSFEFQISSLFLKISSSELDFFHFFHFYLYFSGKPKQTQKNYDLWINLILILLENKITKIISTHRKNTKNYEHISDRRNQTKLTKKNDFFSLRWLIVFTNIFLFRFLSAAFVSPFRFVFFLLLLFSVSARLFRWTNNFVVQIVLENYKMRKRERMRALFKLHELQFRSVSLNTRCCAWFCLLLFFSFFLVVCFLRFYPWTKYTKQDETTTFLWNEKKKQQHKFKLSIILRLLCVVAVCRGRCRYRARFVWILNLHIRRCVDTYTCTRAFVEHWL